MSNILVNTIKDTGNNTLLSSDGSGSVTASSSLASSVQSVGGIQNTPSFFVRKTTAQSIGDSTYTTIEYDDVIYDTHSAFSTSTYRYTPTVAGYYWVFAQLRSNSSTDFTSWQPFVYKNGSKHSGTNNSHWHFESVLAGVIVQMNGTSDYIEIKGFCDGSSIPLGVSASEFLNYFGAFRIIGA